MAISRIETNSIAPSQTLTTPIIATTMGVGGATPAGSGSGITFPATQSASTDVNTLDDYEEGTFTPFLSTGGLGVTATYAKQLGYYTKVGNMVFVTVRIDLSSASGGTGSLFISGLPFTVGKTDSYPATAVGYKANWVTNGPDFGRFNTGNAFIEMYKSANTGETNITPSNLSSNTAVIFSGSYLV